TFDDLRRGPDGVPYTADDIDLHPLANVEVFILGRPDLHTCTDAAGFFELTDTPVGNVKVVVNGRTASNAPGGFFFPEMTMDLTLEAGRVNTMMGSMGARERMAANEERLQVYLPRLEQAILRPVDNTQNRTITLDPESAHNLTPEQIGQLRLEFEPGSLIGDDGQPLATAQIGISVVPPELVRDMMPPGVARHGFDITIQAPGVAAFATPLPISFPNDLGLPPGTKANLLSFDHTTGRLEVRGSMTVSEDGTMVVSDPGTGVTQPGWHWWLSNSKGSGGKKPPCSPVTSSGSASPGSPSVLTPSAFFLTGDTGGSITIPDIRLTAPVGSTGSGSSSCPIGGPSKTYTLSSDGPLLDFVTVTVDGSPVKSLPYPVILLPGNAAKIVRFTPKSYAEMSATWNKSFAQLERDMLYGAAVKLEIVDDPGGGGAVTSSAGTRYVYRWVDVVDADAAVAKTGNTAAFFRTLADGSGSFVRHKDVDVNLPKNATTKLSFTGTGSTPFNLNTGTQLPTQGETRWTFDPVTADDWTSDFSLAVTPTSSPSSTITMGTIQAIGKATAKTTVSVDLSGFKDELKRVIGALEEDGGYFEYNEIDAQGEHHFTTARDKFVDHFGEILPGHGLNPTDFDRKVDALIDPIAEELFQEVSLDFLDLVPAITVVRENTAADVRIAWADIVGHTSKTLGETFADDSKTYYYPSPIDKLVDVVKDTSVSDAAKQWEFANSINKFAAVNPSAGGIASTIQLSAMIDWHGPTASLKIYDLDPQTNGFAQYVANTVSHELAHTFGLQDAYLRGHGSVDPFDIMGSGDPVHHGNKSFAPPHVLTLQAAMGAQPDGDLPLSSALATYKKNYKLPQDESGFLEIIDDVRGWLEVRDEGRMVSSGTMLDLGEVIVDGASSTTVDLEIVNAGNSAVEVLNIHFADPSAGLSLAGDSLAGASLLPGEQRSFSVRFMPTRAGLIATKLLVVTTSTATPTFELGLRASGLSASPIAHLSVGTTNLGGIAVGASSERASVFTIRNDGAGDLVISDIRFDSGGESFSIAGGVATGASTPTVLGRGEQAGFSVSFHPTRQGMEAGELQIVTNDPHSPVQRVSVLGTGTKAIVYPRWGNDYVAIEFPDLANGTTLRTRSDASGNFEIWIPQNEAYHEVVFDPETGLVAHGYGRANAAGELTDLSGTLVFAASTAPDSDFDGLPDDIEFAIGTSSSSSDSDRDGLSDFAEWDMDSDPLDGRSLPARLLAVTSLLGEAKEVVLAGRTDGARGQIAYVATGSHGLAIVDSPNLLKPIVVGQLNLPGDAVD
ncbi:MAG TPA: hypothetical protein DCQ94_16980, partial [Nitrospira sp.]|nr:hypothetical protein [Nitrospira sp.]